jgi:dihydroorotate dehydrogenase
MYKLLFPLLNQIDAEALHNGVRDLARFGKLPGVRGLLRGLYHFEDKRLTQEHFGLTFNNPVGLAAGFDKYGAFIDIMPNIGFGFMELGSISAQPRLGNPQPRLFRLPQDQAIINRMGLNNDGAEATKNMLMRKGSQRQMPLGISIVKTHDPNIVGEQAIADFVKSYTILAPLADYIALNISCPNTQEGKTFEDPEALEQLLTAIQQAAQQLRQDHQHVPPLFVKISPDRTDTEIVRLVSVCSRATVDGYILTNTSANRDSLETPQVKLHEIGMGGLSGAPLFEKSLRMIRMVRNIAPDAFIIGVGGIQSAADAYAMICAGASLLQIYTGLIYNGPGLVKQINRGLVHRLEADGFSSITEAIGSQIKQPGK